MRIQRLQNVLPLNPQGQGAVSPDLAFNTAVSFMTNTNWQSYVPETTMSYLTQMSALTVHNFVSAATGIALAIALIRGFARRSAQTIGNFWVDLTRCMLYILLPISIVVGLVLVWQGMPQNLLAYTDVDHAGRRQAAHRPGAGGLAGSHQDAGHQRRRLLQCQLGASIRESERADQPDPDAADLLDRRGADQRVRPHGRDQRQGWAIFAVMGVLFLAGVTTAYYGRSAGQPGLAAPGRPGARHCRPAATWKARKSASASPTPRCSPPSPPTLPTAPSTTCMTASLPLAGMVPMVNIMLGEIIFGGVGSGLYGMLLFVIVAMFVAGLMVGRTPEYLGKKLEAKEVKMAMLAILILPLSILGFTALAVVLPVGTGAMNNAGPHGFSEVLYAYVSATGNNGSAFAGISANVPFYNTTQGVAMFIGRFLMIVPMLAIAGSLARKKIVPISAGTFPTDSPLFVGLVIGVIAITGGLILLPGDFPRAGRGALRHARWHRL